MFTEESVSKIVKAAFGSAAIASGDGKIDVDALRKAITKAIFQTVTSHDYVSYVAGQFNPRGC